MISIHQSQFIPWLPYFYKILKSDIFIIMDDVQYQKNGLQNRNMIKTPTGESYLTIPVKSKSTSLINEVEVQNKIFIVKMLKTLKNNYSKAQYFDCIYGKIQELVESNKYLNLNCLNKDLILLFLELMEANNTKIKYSSEFNFKSKKDDLVIDLIVANNDKQYISGTGGLSYMDMDKFAKNEIDVYLYDFNYVEYKQLWPKVGFIKNLSILDLLFNDLEIAKDYILENGSIKLLEK